MISRLRVENERKEETSLLSAIVYQFLCLPTPEEGEVEADMLKKRERQCGHLSNGHG